MNDYGQDNGNHVSVLSLVALILVIFNFDKLLGLSVWLGVVVIPLYLGFLAACFPPAILLWIWPLFKKSDPERLNWIDRIWDFVAARNFRFLVRFGGAKDSWKQTHFWFIWTISLLTCIITWLIVGIWFIQNYIHIAVR